MEYMFQEAGNINQDRKKQSSLMCFYANIRIGLEKWEGGAALGEHGAGQVGSEGQGKMGGRAVYTNWR